MNLRSDARRPCRLPLPWRGPAFAFDQTRRLIRPGAALLAAALLAGCSGPPEELMEQTREAETEAEEAGAARYAAALLDSAQTAFATAENEMAVQGEKFVLLRNYKEAQSQAQRALRQFQEANKAAVSAKNSMRGPVRTLMRETNAAVDAAEQLLAKRILRGRNGNLPAWQDEIVQLRRALANASKAERDEDYPTAKATLDSASARVEVLRAALESSGSGGVDGV